MILVVIAHTNITQRKQSEQMMAMQARRAEGLLSLPAAAEPMDERIVHGRQRL